jgi:hypothetical protein
VPPWSETGRPEAYISLTAWLTTAKLTEQLQRGETPAATLHVLIPHGRGERAIAIRLGLDQCLALSANAADAARLLAAYRSVLPNNEQVDAERIVPGHHP